MRNEIWKPIPNYWGLYEVSNKGNVKSLEKTYIDKSGRFQRKNGKLLSPGKNPKGYHLVVLYNEGSKKGYQVHQLVAMAFLNHIPDGHNVVVDHIDNNKDNNQLSNLQLLTNRENVNKDRGGSSKYSGVYWNKSVSKWISRITVNYKSIHLGVFKTELGAYLAYVGALEKLKNNEL